MATLPNLLLGNLTALFSNMETVISKWDTSKDASDLVLAGIVNHVDDNYKEWTYRLWLRIPDELLSPVRAEIGDGKLAVHFMEHGEDEYDVLFSSTQGIVLAGWTNEAIALQIKSILSELIASGRY